MAEETLASAVSIPQSEALEPADASPDAGHKRRKSSVSEYGTKRRRISDQRDIPLDDEFQRSPPQSTDGHDITTTKPSRKLATATEERKRGQRLFGGLLGTLSQTSSSAAQKRRADIEQRQQAKLKQQDEQHSEAKRRRKEEIVAERRKQQKELDRASMTLRHQNLLQVANFLRTKVEPVLLWRPFQLQDEDEDVISRQRQEAEGTVTKEVSEFEERWRQQEQEENQGYTNTEEQPNGRDDLLESEKTSDKPNEHQSRMSYDNNSGTGREAEAEEQGTEDDVQHTITDKDEQISDNTHLHSSQRQDDEAEGLMEEDKEDMVLY